MRRQRGAHDVRRQADARGEVRELEHGTEHFELERFAVLRRRLCARADHAAEIQKLQLVADTDLLRHRTRVAVQRVAMSERARDDVAGMQRDHAAVHVLERVVGGLRVLDATGDDRARLRRNRFAEHGVSIEAEAQRDRGDLVECAALHFVSSARPFSPARRYSRAGSASARARPSAPCGVAFEPARSPYFASLAVNML